MNECKIVEDLLPLYAEELVSEESAEFIRDHSAHCERCQKLVQRSEEVILMKEQDYNEYKKAIRRDKLKMVSKGVLTFLLVAAVILGPVIGIFYYVVWENGTLRAEGEFVSDMEDGFYRIDVYDWDTAGFFDTGAGSIIRESWSIRVVDEDGIGNTGGMASSNVPWENIRVDWAPNGQDSLVTVDLVWGGTGHFILVNDYWINEDGRSVHSSKTIPSLISTSAGLSEILIPQCRMHPDFPSGWQEIQFSFYAWADDSETITFVYETDNGFRGFLDYHYPTESITSVD